MARGTRRRTTQETGEKRRERNWKRREAKRQKDSAVKTASLQDFARSNVPQGKAVVEISTNGESGISTELLSNRLLEGSFSLQFLVSFPQRVPVTVSSGLGS